MNIFQKQCLQRGTDEPVIAVTMLTSAFSRLTDVVTLTYEAHTCDEFLLRSCLCQSKHVCISCISSFHIISCIFASKKKKKKKKNVLFFPVVEFGAKSPGYPIVSSSSKTEMVINSFEPHYHDVRVGSYLQLRLYFTPHDQINREFMMCITRKCWKRYQRRCISGH